MNRDSIFKILREDYAAAKRAKIEIDKLHREWNDLYYGKSEINSKKKGKKTLLKETAKLIELQKPNITEPFLSSLNPIKVTKAGRVASASEVEAYANQVFCGEIDREALIEDLVDILLREGTVWLRSGWKRQEIIKTVNRVVSMDEILEMNIDPKEINEIEPDVFEIEVEEKQVLKNHPSSRVCRNANIFPDPAARQENEMNFCIEKRYVTYYDLVGMNITDKNKLSILKNKIEKQSGQYHDKSAGELAEDDDDSEYGYNDSDTTVNLNRTKVQLIEYWGYYDLEGKGKKVAMVASWIHEFEMLLELRESPLPSQEIPYRRAVYSSRPSSLWGNGVPFFIGESQKVKNGLVKGILDSLALANSGQKYVARGGLDVVNFNRLRNRERYVMVNKPGAIEDGKHNQIPGSTFELMKLISSETGELAGTDGRSISNNDISKDGAVQLSLAQQKMVSIVRKVSGLLGRNVIEWIRSAEVFLDDNQIIELFSNDGDDENNESDLNAFKDSSMTKITMTVGTKASRQYELQQLNMLMQQSKVLGEQLPPGHLNKLVAKMYVLFDMVEESKELLNYRPEPSLEQQQMQQMKIQEQQLIMQKLEFETRKLESEIMLNNALAQNSVTKTESEKEYKIAQSTEKMAKAEGHMVNNTLRPGEAKMEEEKKQVENYIKLNGGNKDDKRATAKGT